MQPNIAFLKSIAQSIKRKCFKQDIKKDAMLSVLIIAVVSVSPMYTLLNALTYLSPKGLTSVQTRILSFKKTLKIKQNLVLCIQCGGPALAMIITEVM